MTGDVGSPPPSGGGADNEKRGSRETKRHLYYGKINETTTSSAAAVCEEAPIGERSPEEMPAANAESPPSAELGTNTDAAVKQHEERLKAFQIHQAASSFKTVAPTIDADVRDVLRYGRKGWAVYC